MNSKPTILYDEKNYIHLASPQYDKLGIVTEYFDIKPNPLAWIRTIQEIYGLSSLNDNKCILS